MSCSTLLPVCCECKHHILYSLIRKKFYFKIRSAFEFDQTNENSPLKHSDGSRVGLCNENLRMNSRSPGLSIHGYCGGLALAASQTSTQTLAHSLLSGGQGRK